MPIYEYDCPECGVIEVMQKITEVPLTECPQCLEKGSHNGVKRRVSLTSFQLKGSGWYKTDYSNGGSSGKNGHSSSSNQKNETGSKNESGCAKTPTTEKKSETASPATTTASNQP